jgi:hypothetical protein
LIVGAGAESNSFGSATLVKCGTHTARFKHEIIDKNSSSRGENLIFFFEIAFFQGPISVRLSPLKSKKTRYGTFERAGFFV